uniref:Uncharacterized protein n=1 Tax=Chrysotila carterae TaxID=13221 RepID=A0A7S4F8Q2_CHRCT
MIGCTGSCHNGRCVNGTCVCNAGWSGNQDLWTQDLSRWGGPVLNCPTPVKVLQVAWAIYLFLAVLLWLMMLVSIRQQWRKYQDLKNAGKVKHWFEHFPLAYLLLIFFVVLPTIVACSIVKLASQDLSELVGATTAATVVFTITLFTCPSIIAFFMVRALNTFAFSGLDNVARVHSLKVFCRAVNWLFVVAAATIILSGLYPVVSLSKSPFENQDFHKFCTQLYVMQLINGHILLSLAAAMMGGRITVAMNGIISNRLDLALRTNQSDIFASVASLRRTRLKICLVFASCSVGALCNAGLLATAEVVGDYLLFIGIAYDTQNMIAITLAYSSVLSYTAVPAFSFRSTVCRSAAANTAAATGNRNTAVEGVDLEQPQDAPQEPNELEPDRARELQPEQRVELQAEQIVEVQPEQTVDLQLEQTVDLQPERREEPQVGRREGWDIGGPAHLAC